MFIDKLIGDKRQWREYRARVKRLPDGYREAVDALQRYLMYFGGADGSAAAQMFDDLADLFERAAADGVPVRDVVGENPVEFMDAFIENYDKGGWVTRERERLAKAIDRAVGDTAADGSPDDEDGGTVR